MYIQPSTNIRLLKGVNLDNSYEHTIYFANETAQRNYFISKTKHNLTAQTFQRTGRGTARLKLNVGDCYDCNYMMFQNSAFSSKWFYAFITSVEYINNEVTEIAFEMDVMQTWLFNYELGQCYIERQHTVTDDIGDNIVPEPVALGEYVFNNDTGYNYGTLDYRTTPGDLTPLNGQYLNDLCVLIAIVDVRATASEGNVYDNIYSAAKIYAYDKTDVTGINAKVTEFIQSPDSILSMYMCPKIAVPQQIPASGGILLDNSSQGVTVKHTATQLTTSATLDGHVVRNKKLFTYPYNFYHVDNSCGNAMELRYEFFNNLTPELYLLTTLTQPIDIVLKPRGYKNVSGQFQNESISISGFPMCSWNVDAYKAWCAQSSIPLVMNGAASLAQGALMGGEVGFAGALIGTVANTMSQMYTASIAADMSKGSFSNGGANCSKLQNAFYGGRMSVTNDMAKRIDDFFDYFGYQINELAVPNRNARRYWTYLKTATCVIIEDIPGGGVPNDDLKRITDIYNKGITWWNNGNNVGNYSLDNRV